MRMTDDELAELKDIKKRKRGQDTGYTCEIYNETLDALINRLEAAEACLFDVWHSSIADDKLEAWKRACGKDDYSKLAETATRR